MWPWVEAIASGQSLFPGHPQGQPLRVYPIAQGDAGDRVPRSSIPEDVVDRLGGFRQGLKETGYSESETATIEYRWAENQLNRLPALAADLVRRRVS
jgi:hypothetical protein